MNAITSDELSQLSILNCKICTRRLQHPVMQVGTFGNICGNCYENSAYTNVTENTEIKLILSKFHFYCNYREQGCDVRGLYYELSDHENKCGFRNRVCPFSYQGACSNKYINQFNIVEHFEICHKENILKAENDCFSMQNPIYDNQNIFYLLIIEPDEKFLIRIQFDAEKLLFLYLFYYFKITTTKFTFFEKQENLLVKSDNIELLPEFEVSHTFDYNHSLKIKQALLESLGCYESIRISVISEKKIESAIDVIYDWKTKFLLINELECYLCKRYEDIIYYCNCIDRKCCLCHKSKDNCTKCRSGYKSITTESLNQNDKYPCKNAGCNEYIALNEYKLHFSNCSFRTYTCRLLTDHDCNWVGFHENIYPHLMSTHENLANTKLDFLIDVSTLKSMIFYVHNVFVRWDCKVSKTNLTCKVGLVGPNYLCKLFLWELHLLNSNTHDKTIVTGECIDFWFARDRNVNVEEYLVNQQLRVFFDIKNKHDIL